jgi:hypothetical protein
VLGRVVQSLLGNPEQSLFDRDRKLRLGIKDLVHGDAVPRRKAAACFARAPTTPSCSSAVEVLAGRSGAQRDPKEGPQRV